MARKARKLVTLREASVQTGVSVSALRKWYRAEQVYSEMVPGPNGAQRVVDVDEVTARAARIQEDRAGPGVVAVPSDIWRETVASVASAASQAGELAALRSEMVALRSDVARLSEIALRTEESLRLALAVDDVVCGV